MGPTLDHFVTCGGIKIEVVDLPEFSNQLERIAAECTLAVKGVQDDALEQIAQRHVVIFRQPLHHLQQPFLDADSGLNALYRPQITLLLLVHMYHGNKTDDTFSVFLRFAGPFFGDDLDPQHFW